MAVEMFSWPSLHERMCRTWGSNSGPLACQANTLPIELPRPAPNFVARIIAWVSYDYHACVIYALHVCELQANFGPNFARSSCGICKCVVNTNLVFKLSLIRVFSRNFVSPTSPQLSQPSELLALLATDIIPSEQCPVLSKCITKFCSHEKFAIFICMYLQKRSSGTASISLIKVISGSGLSCDIVHFAWSVALVHGHKNFLVLFCEVKLFRFYKLR